MGPYGYEQQEKVMVQDLGWSSVEASAVKGEDYKNIGSDPFKGVRGRSGRKPVHESRATEFRERLIAWKQTPESGRLSLRALARQLGTSHQLLKHYLDGLEKWRYEHRCRKANEKSDQKVARAIVDRRAMTQREERERHACTEPGIGAMVGPLLLDVLAELAQEATGGPLHPDQFKMVKIFAKQGFPGAEELLQKCKRDGVKKTKPFAEIVKETPRQEGETCGVWVRRIWNQCDKYDTKCLTVITEELLENLSRGSENNQKNNLPAISDGSAKSIRTV